MSRQVLTALLIVIAGLLGGAAYADDDGAPVQAKYRRTATEIQVLLRSRRDAALHVWEARLREFLVGRGTQNFTLAYLRHGADAELALATSERDRLAVCEKYWLWLRIMEAVNRERSDAGRISHKDYLQVQYLRLGAELALIPLWSRSQESKADISSPPPTFGPAATAVDLLAAALSKDRARAKRDALRADPRDLKRARRAAIWTAFVMRERNYLAGRGTQEFLIEVMQDLREADLALADRTADRLAALEFYWITARQNEAFETGRFYAGHIALCDYQISRYDCLGAQIALLQAEAKADVGRTSTTPLVAQSQFFDPASAPWANLLSAKELVQARSAMRRADVKELMQAKQAAASVIYAERAKELREFRGTLEYEITAARRLRDADLDLAAGPAERTAARERYWKRLQWIEKITKQRSDSGRISTQDYQSCRYHRLGAEIGLAQAKP